MLGAMPSRAAICATVSFSSTHTLYNARAWICPFGYSRSRTGAVRLFGVTQPPPQGPPWNPGRAAGNTVVVIATIVGVCIGLPLLACVGWLIFGSVLGMADPNH